MAYLKLEWHLKVWRFVDLPEGGFLLFARKYCNTLDLGPVHTHPDMFENGGFCRPFLKIYASTRSVFEAFLPVHTKTHNNVRTIALC